MPRKNQKVSLSVKEVERLKCITHKGSKESAKTIMHANILLLSNDSLGDKKKTNREISEIFDVSPNTVNQVRYAYSTQGLEASLNRKRRITPPVAAKITGEFEAQMIAMALRKHRKVMRIGR